MAARDGFPRDDRTEKWMSGKPFFAVYSRRTVRFSQIDLVKSRKQQVRIIETPLDMELVESYAEKMRAGVEFPPVVLYEPARGKLFTVDGNHRLGAYERLGVDAIFAYVLDTKTPLTTVQLMQATANTMHGKPLSREEQKRQAEHLLNMGMDEPDVASALGVKVSTVRGIAAAITGRQRAIEARIDPQEWEDLPQTTRNRLASLDVDRVLRPTVRLVRDAVLSLEETSELVAALKLSGSAAKQLEMLKQRTEVLRPRIQSIGAGEAIGKGRAPNPLQRYNSALGMMLALPEIQPTLVGVGPLGLEHLAERIAEVQKFLGECSDALTEAQRASG